LTDGSGLSVVIPDLEPPADHGVAIEMVLLRRLLVSSDS
jgi:hypothetical protein